MAESTKQQEPKVLIGLGSQSPLKTKAVQKGFSGVDGAVVQGCSASSGVSDQPCGITETLLGANNRAKEAQKLIPDADIIIAIENGMVYGHHKSEPDETSDESQKPFIGGCPSESGWTDVAAIVILTPKMEEKHHVVWSDHIAIPSDAVKHCLPSSGTEDAKQGKEVKAMDTWSPLKDPHSDLTGCQKNKHNFL